MSLTSLKKKIIQIKNIYQISVYYITNISQMSSNLVIFHN